MCKMQFLTCFTKLMKRYITEEVKHWTKKLSKEALKEKYKYLKTLHARLQNYNNKSKRIVIK